MARKNAVVAGAAKPCKKRDAVSPPPLTQEEFETAFRAYCAEKGLVCRLRRRLYGREITVHALYNHTASFGGPEGASAARSWSRIADRLSQGSSHKAGIAAELARMHALALEGFEPVALRLYPEALKRPPTAYAELIPFMVPGPPESPGEKSAGSPAPGRAPRVSAAQLKALKRFGAIQEGGSVKRARLEGPTGPLHRVATSSNCANEESFPAGLYDADDEEHGRRQGANGSSRQRRPANGFGQSLSGLELEAGDPATLGTSGDPHQRHHHHQHHQHNLLGQVVSGLIGSSPRGHKALAQRTAGGTPVYPLGGFSEQGAGAWGPAKPPPRTHGMGQVKGCTTYVFPDPEEDWRPPAACCIATPRAWALQGFACKEQTYGPGALPGMLAWLRHVAQAIGKSSLTEEPLNDTEEAQTYQQYLGRYRRDAYQGLESTGFVSVPDGSAAIRRSGRTRQPAFVQVEVLKLAPAPRQPAPRELVSESDSELEDDEPGVRHGEEYQVEALPRCRARPDGMSPAERRWLTRKLLRPNTLRLPPQCEEPNAFPSMLLIKRLAVVKAANTALVKAVGPHLGALGLRSMGSAAVQASWSDADEALLEEGMRACGRDFRQIRQHLLPAKAVADLIVFYYNVWKTRGSARARAWFLAVEEARRQEMAEEAAYESKRADAEKKRTSAHVAGMQNRQLRDMLAWHRLLARNPTDPVMKLRVTERMDRTVDRLHEEAVEGMTRGAGLPLKLRL